MLRSPSGLDTRKPGLHIVCEASLLLLIVLFERWMTAGSAEIIREIALVLHNPWVQLIGIINAILTAPLAVKKAILLCKGQDADSKISTIQGSVDQLIEFHGLRRELDVSRPLPPFDLTVETENRPWAWHSGHESVRVRSGIRGEQNEPPLRELMRRPTQVSTPGTASRPVRQRPRPELPAQAVGRMHASAFSSETLATLIAERPIPLGSSGSIFLDEVAEFRRRLRPPPVPSRLVSSPIRPSLRRGASLLAGGGSDRLATSSGGGPVSSEPLSIRRPVVRSKMSEQRPSAVPRSPQWHEIWEFYGREARSTKNVMAAATAWSRYVGAK